MSKTRQEKLQPSRSSKGWKIAIEQAERGIAEAKDRIERLSRSINVFRECQERGEPWPGTAEAEPVDVAERWP
jgi:hypothetical protein